MQHVILHAAQFERPGLLDGPVDGDGAVNPYRLQRALEGDARIDDGVLPLLGKYPVGLLFPMGRDQVPYVFRFARVADVNGRIPAGPGMAVAAGCHGYGVEKIVTGTERLQHGERQRLLIFRVFPGRLFCRLPGGLVGDGGMHVVGYVFQQDLPVGVVHVT